MGTTTNTRNYKTKQSLKSNKQTRNQTCQLVVFCFPSLVSFSESPHHFLFLLCSKLTFWLIGVNSWWITSFRQVTICWRKISSDVALFASLTPTDEMGGLWITVGVLLADASSSSTWLILSSTPQLGLAILCLTAVSWLTATETLASLTFDIWVCPFSVCSRDCSVTVDTLRWDSIPLALRWDGVIFLDSRLPAVWLAGEVFLGSFLVCVRLASVAFLGSFWLPGFGSQGSTWETSSDAQIFAVFCLFELCWLYSSTKTVSEASCGFPSSGAEEEQQDWIGEATPNNELKEKEEASLVGVVLELLDFPRNVLHGTFTSALKSLGICTVMVGFVGCCTGDTEAVWDVGLTKKQMTKILHSLQLNWNIQRLMLSPSELYTHTHTHTPPHKNRETERDDAGEIEWVGKGEGRWYHMCENIGGSCTGSMDSSRERVREMETNERETKTVDNNFVGT